MDKYESALKRLRSDRRTLNELKRLTGIPAETLRDIKHGITSSPRFSTLKQIVRFYEQEAA